MNPTTTALVMIEFQNDFTSHGGTLHAAVADVMESTHMLDHAVEAADATREAGAVVVHSPITFQPGYYEITSHPYGILAGVVDSSSFVKDTWGAAFDDHVTPKAGDIVLEGKRGLDAFASTNIDFILRSRGIQTVVLCGFLTNCCVESTMRSAYERGYEVITLTDAVAATSQAEHDNAISYDYPMFSKPMTTAAYIDALKGAVVADASRGY
ncbi:MAG: cysteine hydrolase [Propionibacteriaceae bacterium]|jgi:nicotinamidase-related amidase|nr:cysteine hydrolase [Propionibacteriaceae bacterium]